MRNLAIILIIVLAAIAISLLMRPAAPPPRAMPEPAAVAAPRPAAPAAGPAQPERRAATGVVADLHAAADYATGYTQLKAKKNTQKTIQAIQDQHNQELEQALK